MTEQTAKQAPQLTQEFARKVWEQLWTAQFRDDLEKQVQKSVGKALKKIQCEPGQHQG
jgi:hypothetical protein